MGGLLFLSHAGPDTEAAANLRRAILATPAARDAGLDVWLDVEDIGPGDWQTQIEDGLSRATAFAVIIGKGGVRNWVLPEVRAALDRVVTDGIPFISVSIDPDLDPNSLPLFMRQHQIIRDPLSDETALAELLRAAISTDAQTVVIAEEPYVGLRAMSEADQHLFFGRETEIETALTKLRASELLAIVADSGAGKSSLVRAGLTPAFRRGALSTVQPVDPSRLWHVVTMRPGGDPSAGLARGTDQAAADLGLSGGDRARLRAEVASLDPHRCQFALACDLPSDRTETLLIVDQFEEVLTQAPASDMQVFLDLLVVLAAPGTGVRVVLTIRADYFNLLRRHKAIWDRLHSSETPRMRLGRISDDGLADIVGRPLTLAGYDGETSASRAAADREKTALVHRISLDISDRPGDLALIQIALARVWERSQRGRDSLVGSYASVGGVFGALADGADEVLARLDDTGEDRLFALIVRLVRPGETGGETRRTAYLDEFDDDTRSLAQWLATDEGGRLTLVDESTVEIAHEALIRQWPWLQARLQPELTLVRRLHRLIDRAGAWADPKTVPQSNAATKSSPEPILISGFTRRMIGATRLETAPQDGHERLALGADIELFQSLLDQRPAWLSADEKHFVEASVAHRDAEEDRSRELTRLLDRGFLMAARFGLVVLIALACVGVLGWLAFQAREAALHEAERARAQEMRANARTRDALAASSETASSSGDYQRATMLALAALAAPGPDDVHPAGRRALARASIHLAPRTEFMDVGRSVAAFLDERGACLVIGSEREGLWIRKSSESDPEKCDAFMASNGLIARTEVRTFDVDLDKMRAVVGGRDGRVQLISLQTKEPPLELRQAGEAIDDLALQPNGASVAFTTMARLVVVLDEELLAVPVPQNTRVQRVTFSSDGSMIALGGENGGIELVDAVTGARKHDYSNLDYEAVADLEFSSDGRWVAFAGIYGNIYLWDLNAERPIMPKATIDSEPESLALDSGFNRVAVGSFDGSIRLYSTPDLIEIAVLRLDNGPVLSLDFSNDGRRLVAGTKRGVFLVELSDQFDPQAIQVVCTRLGQDWIAQAVISTGVEICTEAQLAQRLPPVWE